MADSNCETCGKPIDRELRPRSRWCSEECRQADPARLERQRQQKRVKYSEERDEILERQREQKRTRYASDTEHRDRLRNLARERYRARGRKP